MNQDEIREKLVEGFGEDAIDFVQFRDQFSASVDKSELRRLLEFLKSDKDLAFDFLSFVAGVDNFPKAPRFEIVYQLYSFTHNHRFRVKAALDDDPQEGPKIGSVVDLWATAQWHERETAEMFGIVFKNHPDPRNLLLPDYWDAHPLRKDFPLEGNDQTPDLPTGGEGNR